jgi:hypothetical protein
MIILQKREKSRVYIQAILSRIQLLDEKVFNAFGFILIVITLATEP